MWLRSKRERRTVSPESTPARSICNSVGEVEKKAMARGHRNGLLYWRRHIHLSDREGTWSVDRAPADAHRRSVTSSGRVLPVPALRQALLRRHVVFAFVGHSDQDVLRQSMQAVWRGTDESRAMTAPVG